jgi:hypothetical protein
MTHHEDSEHDLVLHVGMPRASAIVAPALRRLGPQLQAHGVAYVEAAQLADLPHGSGWNRDRLSRPRQASDFERELVDLVRAEQRLAGSLWRRRQVPVVIAGDDLLGRGEIGRRDAEQLRPYAADAVAHVVRALSAENVKIVLHTQRQDRLLELAHLRRLRAGELAPIEELPGLSEPLLDYRDLVVRLRAVPNVAEVVVRPVELADAGLRAFVHDVLGLIGVSDPVDLYALGVDLFVHPEALSPRGADLARALYPLVRGVEFDRVRDFLTARHSAPTEYGPPDILDGEARRSLLGRYAETNRQLFAEHMPDLPADSYADDVDTFALGNVLHPPSAEAPTVADRLTTAGSARTNRASTALLRTGRRVRDQLPAAQARRLGRLRTRLGRLV